MNLLISKLLHFFLYTGTLFLAAGAVAEPAAGAAPASSPAPASAPDTSGSQPAPASQPAAEPSIQDIVRESAAEVEKELTAARPAEVAPPAAEPAKPAESATPAAEAAKPAAEPAKPAAVANPLDKLGPLPAEKITAALAEAPQEVKDFLAAKGLTVETLSENARLAAQTSQFLEKVPSMEALDIALEGNANFVKLDRGLPAVKTVEDFDKFMMDTLVPMSFIRDENGQPVPDPNIPGAFKNDGSISKLIDFSAGVRDAKIGELADKLIAAATNDEDKAFATDLKGAVDFLGAFIKNGYQKPGTKAADATKDLPKEVQERLARADQIERDSKARDARTTETSFNQREDRIVGETDKAISPLIKDFLDKTALTNELKALVTKTVWNELTERMLKNDLYLQERDRLSPTAKDYEQRRVALNQTYMKERVVKLLESVVGQFGAPIVDANKDRLNKIDSQSTAGRMEPKTSGTTPTNFPATASGDQFHAKAMELARAENPNAKEGGPEYFRAVLKLDQ
jgi:hypothetical protein